MAIIAEEGLVRVTASLSWSREAELKEVATRHKVSVAWLIRYSVGELVERGREVQLPLGFGRRN